MSAPEVFLDGRVVLHCGDSRDVLRALPDASVHAVVTDPPYALVSIRKRFGAADAAPARDYSGEKPGATGAYARASAGFMGQAWDTGETAFAVEFWAEVMRVLKPGGHVVAFGGTRSFHRLACAIEDAGFELRDCLMWLYGSGFPKSHDVAKGIDRHLGAVRSKVKVPASAVRNPKATGGGRDGMDGATRPWIDAALKRGYHEKDGPNPITAAAAAAAAAAAGWGTALKPAWEPIILARKPLDGTVAETVLAHGTGALNIDGCRIEAENGRPWRQPGSLGIALSGSADGSLRHEIADKSDLGRWPANVVHDGSLEVVDAFPSESGGGNPRKTKRSPDAGNRTGYGSFGGQEDVVIGYGDSGSAARFFYSAKADANDRLGSKHPTVKPVDLMQWLCRLVTPKRVLECPQCDSLWHVKSSQKTNTYSPVCSVPDALQAEGQWSCGEILQSDLRVASKEASGGPLPVVRNDVPTTEGRGAEILQQDLRIPVDGEKPFNIERVCNQQGGIQAPVDAGASAIPLAEGVHLRASMGDAADDWPPVNPTGGGAPQERRQARQSAGELGVDDKGGSRQAEPSSSKHAVLSPLPGDDHHQPTCAHCGHLLEYRPGRILDPFSGTGTTGEAAWREGFSAILIEREAQYQTDIRRRMALALAGPQARKHESAKARDKKTKPLPLFGAGGEDAA